MPPNPLGGETLGTAWTSLWLAHPAHSRTEPEEADKPRATKTGQLNSLSTPKPSAEGRFLALSACS